MDIVTACQCGPCTTARMAFAIVNRNGRPSFRVRLRRCLVAAKYLVAALLGLVLVSR